MLTLRDVMLRYVRVENTHKVKVKVKVNVDLYSDLYITPLRRSGMARVLKGSHSFTCTPRVHPLSE